MNTVLHYLVIISVCTDCCYCFHKCAFICTPNIFF